MKNRERKYRVWDIDGEQYITESGYIQIAGNGTCVAFDQEVWQDKVIVEDWTGLKDKNGVDIYEGDIVKCWDNAYEDPNWPFDKQHIGVIEYRAPRFVLAIGNTDITSWDNAENIEVIGNIHQNPELLNK